MTFNLDMGYLAVLAAVGLRCAILMATLPFLDQSNVPVLWRFALASVIALAVAPVVAAEKDLSGLELGWPLVIAEAGRSLLVGALLSVTIGLLFAIVRYAGQISGMQIGFAIVNVVDPQSGGKISILGQLYYLLAATLFFAVDAHHMVLSALVHSCTVLPLFEPLDVAAGAWILLRDAGTVFRLGLQIAAPCVIVLLLVSATMGVVVKTMPQLNVLVVGFPIKIGVGLVTVGFSLVIFRNVFLSLLAGVEEKMVQLLTALS